MSEKQKTLTLTLDDKQVALTIVRATARVGVERYLLTSAGVEANKSEPSEALKILHLTLYPDLISATSSVDGLTWPLTFDEFVELPEEFVNSWADAVYAMNTTWRPAAIPAEGSVEATEKKIVKHHKGKTSLSA